jgi:hypothetical protein
MAFQAKKVIDVILFKKLYQTFKPIKYNVLEVIKHHICFNYVNSNEQETRKNKNLKRKIIKIQLNVFTFHFIFLIF